MSIYGMKYQVYVENYDMIPKLQELRDQWGSQTGPQAHYLFVTLDCEARRGKCTTL